jgi:hypothetical protein
VTSLAAALIVVVRRAALGHEAEELAQHPAPTAQS